MRFATRHRIDGTYSGRHRSRQQGGAGEFVDFREYSGSEDLRRLDWKVFGRTGKAFVRLHQDETNLLCTLALDASGSMQFNGGSSTGGPLSKLEYAQFLATALSHIISGSQDQVGLAILTDHLREFMAPRATLTHIALLQEKIEQLCAEPSTSMAEGLHELFERSRGRGTLLLMSDFLMQDLEAVSAAIRLFRHRGWEIVLLHIVHPREERLPEGTAYLFVGLEGDGSQACSPFEICAEYERRFKAHLAMVRQLALAAGCDYRFVSTSVPYLRTLQGFLVERSG